MKPLHVEWVHGWDARPWGTKSTMLREEALARSVTMEALDYQDVRDPDRRGNMLVKRVRELEKERTVVLAGSSMGGYVSLAACREVRVRALWLLCPALCFPECKYQEFPWVQARVSVVHGWNDEAVPVDSSFRFARTHQAELHVIRGDHRFTGRLKEVSGLFVSFLESLLAEAGNR